MGSLSKITPSNRSAFVAVLGAMCAIVVAEGCAVRFNRPVAAAATASASAAGGVSFVQSLVNVAPVYTNAPNWNDYVKNTGGNGQAWSRCAGACPATLPYTGTACTGAENGYFQCIHGGEYRYFQVTNESSCTGLTAQDHLGVFNWACDSSTGQVVFISRGLKEGKGLRDLLTTAGFKTNYVTVSAFGTPIFQTATSNWYSGNTVALLPTVAAAAKTMAANTIYVTQGNTSAGGYFIGNIDKVGIVSLGSDVISWNVAAPEYAACAFDASGVCFKSTTQSRFHWIEVSLDISGALVAGHPNGIMLGGNVLMSRFHNIQLNHCGSTNCIDDSVSSSASNNANLVDYARMENALDGGNASGLSVANQTYFTVKDTVIGQADQAGVAGTGGTTSVLYNITISNGQTSNFDGAPYVVGLTIFGTSGAAGGGVIVNAATNILNATVANITGGDGILVRGPNVRMTNIFVGGIQNNGINLQSGNNAIVTDIMAAYNGTGVDTTVGDTGNLFNGNIWVGQNSFDCSSDPGTSNITGVAPSCQRGGTAATTGIDPLAPVSAFVGAISGTDLANTSNQSVLPVPYASATDWANFSSFWRNWGLDSALGLFNAARQGACASGTSCEIYDWSLSAARVDGLMLNAHGAFSNGNPCPSSIDASIASNVGTSTTGAKYLLHAVEIMDPFWNPNGNFNGLCESGETCIYAPNIGAYQGTGDFSTQTCSVTGGNGVFPTAMYAYPVNGN